MRIPYSSIREDVRLQGSTAVLKFFVRQSMLYPTRNEGGFVRIRYCNHGVLQCLAVVNVIIIATKDAS